MLGAATGWWRGALLAAADVLALVGAFAAAWFGYGYLAWWLSDRWPELDRWLAAFSFAGVFVVAATLLAAVGQRAARMLPSDLHAHPLNRMLGVLPGVANGAFQAVVAVALLAAQAGEGPLAKALRQPAAPLQAALAPIFDPALRDVRHVETLPNRPDATVALTFRSAAPVDQPVLADRMLGLVNSERASQGLGSLQPDAELATVAAAHGRDMLARGYFSHYAPEGTSMADRLRTAEVRYRIAGENLALARSLAGAHEGLMKSPGHRANILRPQFGRAGISVLDAGRHGLVVTQVFRD